LKRIPLMKTVSGHIYLNRILRRLPKPPLGEKVIGLDVFH
jgi:hypothetical protein